MSGDLKAVVVGTGSIGTRHLNVLKGLGVETMALPIRESRRRGLESEGWQVVESLEAAKKLGATAAIIATDTKRHAADTGAALRLQLHVLLEKPMGTAADEVRHLPELAAKHSLSLCIACPLRFDPGLGVVRQRLREIGAVHGVEVECRSYLPEWRPDRDYRQTYSSRADEGGVLRDLIHEVDYALWLFGVPQFVFGRLNNLGRLGIESEEMAEGIWTVAGGTNVTIKLDYLSRPAQRSFRAWGELGEIEYDLIARNFKLRLAGAALEEIKFPQAPNDIYIHQMSEFLRIASGDVPKLIATAEDGVRALSVCDAWRQSSTGKCMEKVRL